MIKRIFLGTFFIFGLIYILAPGPQSIDDIPQLPGSLKSEEPGDTYQNPNIAAYFSNYRRKYVTDYYRNEFGSLNFWGLKIPPIRLNHPPEEAFQYIRDQERTKYLEQYFYPLRDALYVNGYEPFDENGKKFDSISVPIYINGYYFTSKATLRYYHAPLFWRLMIYITGWISALFLIKLFGKTLKTA